MLDCDHQSFPAGTLRKIFRHERCDLRLLSHRRAAHDALAVTGKVDYGVDDDTGRDGDQVRYEVEVDA